ncbi:MAG: hypothetical protein AVDCRST_MAG56-8199, partial [uncultured Cytophagales bacterium]
GEAASGGDCAIQRPGNPILEGWTLFKIREQWHGFAGSHPPAPFPDPLPAAQGYGGV